MIKLQPTTGQITLPCDSIFSYHRLYVDYQELFDISKRVLNDKCYTEFQTPTFSDNIFKMNLAILCKEGQYTDIVFRLEMLIPKEYPFMPPKIYCSTKTSHPFIQPKTGEVFVPILKETDWLPIHNMCSIFSAIESTLAEPDMDALYKLKYNTRGDMVFEEEAFLAPKEPLKPKCSGGCYASKMSIQEGFKGYLQRKIQGDVIEEVGMSLEGMFDGRSFVPNVGRFVYKDDDLDDKRYKFARKRPSQCRNIIHDDLKKLKKTLF